MEKSTKTVLVILAVSFVVIVGTVVAAAAVGLHLRNLLPFHFIHFLRHG
ncbi:MAG: hypothetical protein OK456_04200 [Thaumarchaeota archaeon]|nr:hypothetical protein [Nitrososphaerota archaeon]